ncbi:MAG: hypothetical protein N2049_04285 [Anaerolineales bacterium]|nr:hypothetical protein [Anaerolineales bacterium]MCX7608421.1 hypothetical protein [Anaerolineales bacterium]MDW8227076.1 hypothetical protein [Anaerolineales bacterium]
MDFMKGLRSPFLWFLLCLVVVAGLAAIGPEEKTLGPNVRIVYLHGAWVLAAEACLASAAFSGLVGILSGRKRFHDWSQALGRSGIIFWVTYLPLSLWAMQANWNGLFLAEPRFRVGFVFALTGILLQVGLALLGRPVLTSLGNVLFFTALLFALRQAGYVMHPPPSPIFESGIPGLQIYFLGLIVLVMSAAYFLTRWFLHKQS